MNYTPEIRRILVPIPNGSAGKIALRQAMIFQEVYGSEIVLLHVVPAISVFHRILRPSQLKKHLKRSKRKLARFTKKYFHGEVPEFITLRIVAGSLIQKILTTADRINCDLIIIKKRERINSRLGYLKKENADKLISGAKCPVLTIHGNFSEQGIKNILVPVDITKKITNKVVWLKSLAKRFDATVHVVSVLNLNIAPISSLAYQKALRIEESIKEAGIKVNVILLKGKGQSMHDVVLSHIEELKPDMVLIMTHQESILFDNYIGKFAGEVIHRSNSPILSLVPRKETMVGNILDSFTVKKTDERVLI